MVDPNRRDWMLGSASVGLLAEIGAATSPTPVRLSLNENAFGPSPTVASAVRSELGYVHPPAARSLHAKAL